MTSHERREVNEFPPAVITCCISVWLTAARLCWCQDAGCECSCCYECAFFHHYAKDRRPTKRSGLMVLSITADWLVFLMLSQFEPFHRSPRKPGNFCVTPNKKKKKCKQQILPLVARRCMTNSSARILWLGTGGKSWRKTFCLIHPGVQIRLPPPQPFSQAVEQRWQHFYTLFWPVGGK